jgi:O-antigen/teichoic acid export membrane protein
VTRGSFYIALQGAATYIVSFLTYVVLTRILSPSEIGELPLLTAAYSVFSTVTMFSLNTATTRYVAQSAGSTNDGDVAGVTYTALKIVAALSLPSFLVVALISPQLTRMIFGAAVSPVALVLVILAAVILNFGTVLVAMLWGLNLFGQMVAANVAGVVTARVVGILLAATPLRLEGYFLGWVIGNCSTMLIALAYSRSYLGGGDSKISARVLLVYSYPIMFSVVVGLVQQWADVTLLYGLTGNLLYTGSYYLGLAGATVLSPIATAISNAIFPSLSGMHGRAEDESFRSVLRVAARALNVLVIPASFCLAAIAPTAVRVAYGGAYLEATIPFALLIISGIFTAYQTLMATVLQSIAKTKPLLTIAAIAAMVEVVLTAALVAHLNVIGSALARCGMVLVSLLLTYWYVKGEWWPSLDIRQLAKCLVLSIICATVLFSSDSYLITRLAVSPLQRLLLDAGLFVVVYLAGLVVLKPLHPEDIDLLKAATPVPLHGPLGRLEKLVVQKTR